MLMETLKAARSLAGALIVLLVALGAAAVIGLALLGGGVAPRIAAAAALVTPLGCGLALRAAFPGSGIGPASLGATLAVAHALVPGS